MESNRDILLNPNAGLGELPDSRLSSLLSEAPAVAGEMLRGAADERPDAHIVIQNVSAIASKALHDHNAGLFSEAITSLGEIWKLGDATAMYPTTTPAFEASLWELIVSELYALGGLAVSLERWAAVHELSVQKPDPDTLRESWLRQGQVASARAATVPDDTMLEIATPPLSRLGPSLSEPDARAALSQFDLLSCLIIRQADPRGFYPNASRFSESLAEPVVFERLRDPNDPLREYVYPGDQDGLREALRAYDEKARIAAAQARRRNHDWHWRGFSDARSSSSPESVRRIGKSGDVAARACRLRARLRRRLHPHSQHFIQRVVRPSASTFERAASSLLLALWHTQPDHSSLSIGAVLGHVHTQLVRSASVGQVGAGLRDADQQPVVGDRRDTRRVTADGRGRRKLRVVPGTYIVHSLKVVDQSPYELTVAGIAIGEHAVRLRRACLLAHLACRQF